MLINSISLSANTDLCKDFFLCEEFFVCSVLWYLPVIWALWIRNTISTNTSLVRISLVTWKLKFNYIKFEKKSDVMKCLKNMSTNRSDKKNSQVCEVLNHKKFLKYYFLWLFSITKIPEISLLYIKSIYDSSVLASFLGFYLNISVKFKF